MAKASAPKISPQAVYTLRVDRRKLDQLRKIAERDYRTLSQELRQMIDERIANGNGDRRHSR